MVQFRDLSVAIPEHCSYFLHSGSIYFEFFDKVHIIYDYTMAWNDEIGMYSDNEESYPDPLIFHAFNNMLYKLNYIIDPAMYDVINNISIQ